MMRQRVLIAATVGILLIQGLLPAQQLGITRRPDAVQPTQQPGETDVAYRTRLAQMRADQHAAQNAAQASPPLEVRIVSVKHYPIQDLAAMLNTLSIGGGTHITVDPKVNRLVVQATPEAVERVLNLIEQLDVELVSAPESQALTCRVYMVELKPKQSDLKTFRAELQLPSSLVSLPALVEAGKGREFAIDAFRDNGPPSRTPRLIEIQGRTASIELFMEVLGRVLGEIPPDAIVRMELDEKTPDLVVPAAQVSELPEPLRQHIHKFLGTEAQTVGYWFGTLSSPGEIQAPIGPWSIQLEVKPAQANGLSMEVSVREWRGDSQFSILSNSIQGKAGKPIIIGYNRELNGSRTMGAMVILLEADTASAGESQTKTP